MYIGVDAFGMLISCHRISNAHVDTSLLFQKGLVRSYVVCFVQKSNIGGG